MKILVSAGEASGDRYAAGVVAALSRLRPDLEFFGCTGEEMRRAGVRTVVDSASLAVVGIVEVLHHIPRIYGEYRKLLAAADRERPALAILTDSPDFHLRVARQLHRRGIPVIYLVAPQAWAWREGRVKQLRRNVTELHCIFPFEEEFFRSRGVEAHFIGHPLASVVRPRLGRGEFLAKHGISGELPLITICPGSRRGEAARHLPALGQAMERIHARRPSTFVVAAPNGTVARYGAGFFEPLCAGGLARVIEGETWDAMAHADVTLAASGTVTVEAALLGSPMVTFYRVTGLTYAIGKPLVKVPFYSMVNLVAGRRLVPELIQDDMTGEAIATETLRLLEDPQAAAAMRAELASLRTALAAAHHADDHSAFEESARRIDRCIQSVVR